MTFKHLFGMFLIFLVSYIAIPILILSYTTNNLDKAAFAIMLILAFLSFALNLFFTYRLGKEIQIPFLSAMCSAGLFFIYNNSVIVVFLIIFILSFAGYFIGALVTKED
ncbi:MULTISPECIES: hypothetical protein [unclassified Gemella]|uniref:hypothetical protein n=1 Tax=unclassified Gemella TaxID=2624949 RepID=UPI001C043C93|nr:MULTISPECIES: hypothetical protein [unclassified Gemella]MBU0278427.1 hypothetical protein [Gemella sp. zg-1178]QWQ38961.1 hypothetical protein KMP11_01025 [Gemella sp. zg-570]